MQPRIFTLSFISLLVALCLALLSGTAISQEVSPGCEAAMDKAAGNLSECLLKAEAQFAKGRDVEVRATAQVRCGEHFDQAAARAIGRYGSDRCTPASLVTNMADRTASFAESVAKEAGGTEAASFLFVQNAEAATLSESTLVLSGVSENTAWFTDRPYRETGQISREAFVALFSVEGPDSFVVDLPNADLACEVEGELSNYIVTLSAPDLVEDTLTYTVNLVESAAESGPLPDTDTPGDPLTPLSPALMNVTCDGPAHLFIDTYSGDGCFTTGGCPGGICNPCGG